MLRNLRIRTKLLVVVAVPIVVLLLTGLLSYAAIQTIKINGPTYNEIKQQSDLNADILPPPQFAVEAFGQSLELIAEGSQIDSATANPNDVQHRNDAKSALRNLEVDFESRHTYWVDNLKDPESRGLLEDVYTTGRGLFDAVNKMLIPAINNPEGVDFDAIRETWIVPAYRAHKIAVERLVKASTARSAALESGANDTVRNQMLTLAALLVGAIAACAIIGTLIARMISRPINAMTEMATQAAHVGIPQAIASITDMSNESGEHDLKEFPVTSNDELGELATAFNAVQATAVDLAGQQVKMNRNYGENLITIGRRNQGLVFRTLGLISELESNERDAGTLENLFRLDHLTTRMRRQAESLLVLAGDTPTSSSGGPVEMSDVVRGALSEVDDYQRVDHTDMDQVSVRGRYVHSVVHLFAELIENAISYSPPNARVTLLGRMTPAGYHVAIIDRGLGMSSDEVIEANARLEDPAIYDLSPVRVLGHHVVSKLSERLGVQVRLHDNLPAPGITASVLLPVELLGNETVGLPQARPVEHAAPVAAPAVHAQAAPVARHEEATAHPAHRPEAGRREMAAAAAEHKANARANDLTAANESTTWPAPSEHALHTPPPGMWPGSGEEPGVAVGPMTKTGFPKRVRGAQAPDTGPARTEPIPERDANALRSSLSGLQSGFERAKKN